MRALRISTVAFVAMMVFTFSPSQVQADHTLFAYKFPCVPNDACFITQLTHGTNAFDFDPQGNTGLGAIASASEGTFIGYFTDADVCTGITDPLTPNAGKFAKIEDIHGRTMIYAHLSQFGSFVPNQKVLQGDIIGIEGNTGRTLPDCPPHLHLGGISTASGIDGIPTGSLPAGPAQVSTNSFVGAVLDSQGIALRAKYDSLGSWTTVGWTESITGDPADGCGSTFKCRLHRHFYPAPATGHWGSRQDFRDHPILGAELSSIFAPRWSPKTGPWPAPAEPAYHLGKGNYQAWVGGGEVIGEDAPVPPIFNDIGLPIMDKIGNDPVLCPSSLDCIAYQRFHLGFVWNHVLGTNAIFCPDLNLDNAVAFADFLLVLQKFGESDLGLNPWDTWEDAFVDLNGDGAIAFADFTLVLQGFATICHPI